MSKEYWFDNNGKNECSFDAVLTGIRTIDSGVTDFTDLDMQS